MPQPFGGRADEPPLRRLEMLVRQAASQGALEQSLVAPQPDLGAVREREHPFDEQVVHEGDADLERVRHRHAVAECEHIVREKRLVIEIQARGKSRGGAVALMQLAKPGARPAGAWTLPQSGGVQSLPVAIGATRDVAEEPVGRRAVAGPQKTLEAIDRERRAGGLVQRSEEHTSELQSQSNLVCRLLLEKKKIYNRSPHAGKDRR